MSEQIDCLFVSEGKCGGRIEDLQRIKALEAENKGLREAWASLRPHLQSYNYDVGGEPTAIRTGIAQFETILKGK